MLQLTFELSGGSDSIWFQFVSPYVTQSAGGRLTGFLSGSFDIRFLGLQLPFVA